MREGRSTAARAALVAGAAIGLALVTGVGAPACFPQGACDETTGLTYCVPGQGECGGRLVTPTKWESGALGGKWIFFPRASGIEMDPRGADGARIKGSLTNMTAWISVCDTPSTFGCNFAVAGGNNAIFYVTERGTIYVKNDTCQDFYVRVVAESDGTNPEAGFEEHLGPQLGDAAAEASEASTD